MTQRRFELGVARPARRALSERLPAPVAETVVELITGPLLDNPRRIGKALTAELTGLFSARVGREWRVLYEIDEQRGVVIVLDIQHRSTAYRPR